MIRIAKFAVAGVLVVALILTALSWMGYKVPGIKSFFQDLYNKVRGWFNNQRHVKGPGALCAWQVRAIRPSRLAA